MKILEGSAGHVTNSEILSVLKDREADKERIISRALPSEIEVYSALRQQGFAEKSRQELQASIEALKEFNLTKEELVQLLNYQEGQEDIDVYLCLEEAVHSERVTEDDVSRILEAVGAQAKQ